MRFTTLVFSTAMLVMSATAQNATSSVAVTVPTTTYGLTPAQSSEVSCLAACPETDVNCRAKCIQAPEGAYAQQNATIDCIDACTQGNGTASDNLAYENCQKACLVSATASVASSTPAATNTGASGAGSGSGSGSGGGSGTGTANGGSSATGTGSAASSTSSKSVADTLRVGVSAAGIMGMFAAVFVL